jgi:hypothetical protein
MGARRYVWAPVHLNGSTAAVYVLDESDEAPTRVVCELTGFNKEWAGRLMREGVLPGKRVGKKYTVAMRALVDFIAEDSGLHAQQALKGARRKATKDFTVLGTGKSQRIRRGEENI